MAFDREIAALTCYCEASSATPAERRMVAATFFNRVKDPRHRYGGSVAEVCLRRFQYSEWNGDARDNENLLRGARVPATDSVMADCVAAYNCCAIGVADPTNGATHYHDKSIPDPAWAKDARFTLETPKFRFFADVP